MANLLNVGFLTLATTLVLWLYSIPGAIKSEAELQRKLPISFIQQLQQVLAPVLGEDRLDKPPTEVPTPQSTGKAPSVLQQILAPLLSPFALSPPVSPPPTSDSTVVPQREVRPFNAWGTRDADGSVHFGPWAHEDEAYVLLMSNDKYIHLLWALEGSFRNVSSTRRRIVMCTPAVSVEMKMILERIGMDVRNIEQPRHNNFKVQFSNWNDTLAKLALFDLPGVTKVVYLDLDTLINHNLDYMFDRDMNAKVYAMSDVIDCSNNITHMNAGLLATLTNKTLKAELMNQLEDPNFFKERKGDQEMLDVYLQKQYVSIFRLSFPYFSLSSPYLCIHFVHSHII